MDWVFTRLFEAPPDPEKPDDVEILVSDTGALLHAAPSGRIPDADLAALAATLRRRGAGEIETEIAGRRFLAVARSLPDLRWIYAKVSPRAALQKRVRAQLDPIFAEGGRRRGELRLLYLAVILALSAALVLVTSRALAPVRRVARAADELAAGRPMGSDPGAARRDEAGRLFRALRNVERRVRWRMATMEGVHRLAQTAALMTRPDETLAQLARQIAQLVGATKAWLALWDPETRSLVGAPPGYGIPEDALRGVRIGLEDPSLTMFVYRTGETAMRNDTRPSVLAPSRGPARSPRQLRLRPAQGRVGDPRRPRRGRQAGRVRRGGPGGDRGLRGPGRPPPPERAALRGAPEELRAPARRPAQPRLLPAEHEPRAPHAAHGDPRVERGPRGGPARQGDREDRGRPDQPLGAVPPRAHLGPPRPLALRGGPHAPRARARGPRPARHRTPSSRSPSWRRRRASR